MAFTDDLAELDKLESLDTPILSVYLNTDPQKASSREYLRLLCKDMRARLEAQLTQPRDAKALHREMERVLCFLESEYWPKGKGLAVFSCEPKGLWHVFQLPMAVQNALYFETRPQLGPLHAALTVYRPYCVVLVDKEKARLFSVHLGQVEEYGDILYPALPGKHKQGGWAAARMQRHHEAKVHEHLKNVVAQLTEYCRVQPFDHLVLAGPNEALTELRRLLPKALDEKVVGTLSLPILASKAAILEAIQSMEQKPLWPRGYVK